MAVTGAAALELPTSEPHDTQHLPDAAAARLAAANKHAEVDETRGRAFDAWEEERRILVSRVPDGTRIERWTAERWHSLGTVINGAVLMADPDLRPTRIRAVTVDGRVTFAVVSQPARLRARLRTPASGRQTEAVGHLPLDVDTVRVLEEALSQLYELSALAGELPPPLRRPSLTMPGPTGATDQPGLLGWMPFTLTRSLAFRPST